MSTYTLDAHVGGTDLTVDADTNFAAADTSGVDAVLKGQPALLRWFVNAWLFVMKLVLAHGAFDHGIAAAMSASQEESLMKLKKVVEATSALSRFIGCSGWRFGVRLAGGSDMSGVWRWGCPQSPIHPQPGVSELASVGVRA